MICVGIDPGGDGGLVAVTSDPKDPQKTSVVAHLVMPLLKTDDRVKDVDIATVADWLRVIKPDAIYIERVGYMPAKFRAGGATSGFGDSVLSGRYRELLGMLKTMKLAYSPVMPAVWQRAVGIVTPKIQGENRDERRKRIKAAVRLFCTRNYPPIDNFIPRRCRVPHDGLMDAAAIAHYGMTRGL